MPDGERVEIKAIAQAEPTFIDLLEFAGCMPDMPADFAAQHDHYIHGTPFVGQAFVVDAEDHVLSFTNWSMCSNRAPW